MAYFLRSPQSPRQTPFTVVVAENWQEIGPMWRDAAFAIFGFLLGVTMALWILILLAAR